MIEELKQILTMVEKVPETVLWVLFGFAVYKLVVWLSATGATVMLIKLAIDRMHDYLVRPKVITYDIGSFMLGEDTKQRFEGLLARLRTRREELNQANVDAKLQYLFSGNRYVHRSDIDFLVAAFDEKLAREKAKGAKA